MSNNGEVRVTVSIGRAARALGVCESTMRRWEREGRIKPVRTLGGHRRYDAAAIRELTERREKVIFGDDQK